MGKDITQHAKLYKLGYKGHISKIVANFLEMVACLIKAIHSMLTFYFIIFSRNMLIGMLARSPAIVVAQGLTRTQ